MQRTTNPIGCCCYIIGRTEEAQISQNTTRFEEVVFISGSMTTQNLSSKFNYTY